MAEKFDAQQVVAFLRRAGDDLRKTGEEIAEEAQRLLAEVRAPQNQQRVRDGLQDLGNWFRRTTSEATDRIEQAVKRAEFSLRGQAERVRKGVTHVAPPAQGSEGRKKRASARKTASRGTKKTGAKRRKPART